MNCPKIGITIDTHDDAGKYESPCDYSKAIERAGGLPLLIPYQSDLSLNCSAIMHLTPSVVIFIAISPGTSFF